jgi:hypothetical protein
MNSSTRKLPLYSVGLVMLIACGVFGGSALSQPQSAPPQATDCTPRQRLEVLRALQTQVLQVAPQQLDALTEAIHPGGPLAGWQLSHGHAVLAGAVPVDNLEAKDPMPQLLLYVPSPLSSPADWLDFDGPDGPYRLIGWAYVAP